MMNKRIQEAFKVWWDSKLPDDWAETERDAFKAGYLAALPKWVSVDLNSLPDYDQPVLWKFETGGIIYESLDIETDITDFLKGNDITGPIIGWMPAPGEGDEL